MKLTECRSDGDAYGCMALLGGEIVAPIVDVTRSRTDGWFVAHGGQAELRECSIM